MFFQINVTPKEKKVRKNVAEQEREEAEREQETFELVLAPFQPQTRMKFESTVFNPVQCSLSIKNPSNRNLNVTVVKTPPKERSMVLSDLELLVNAESSIELRITWTPQEIGSWRDTLQLLDSRRTKYDVALLSTANGPKKTRNQAKPRVLGPSNSNKSNVSCVKTKRISPPLATRESKKTANSTSLSQLNVPSKRPRLTVQQENSNKENASKLGWNFQAPEEKPKNFLTSPEPHDFSAVINSTKFNLTPLNLNVIKFSPQKTEILSPEINAPSLRRETYTAAKYCKIGVVKQEPDEEEPENDENYDDSLSPQPEDKKEENKHKQQQKCQKMSSDFSILINDLNLLTPVRSQPIVKFSPNDCSTGNRGKLAAAILTPIEKSPGQNFAGDNTFDVSASNIGNNSPANGTYELPNSPTRSSILEPIKPTRLSKSFAMSPVLPSISGESNKIPTLSSSSPICFDTISSRHEIVTTHRHEYSTRTSFSQISQLQFDDASVKEVLEADLWAKSTEITEKSQTNITNFSTLTITKTPRCTSLERIDEEASTSSATFNKTKTFDLSSRRDQKSTKTRRMEISPPKKHFSSGKSNSPIRRVSPTKGTKIRKEKTNFEPVPSLRKKVQLSSIKRGQVSIPGVRIANLSLAGLSKTNSNAISGQIQKNGINKSSRHEPKEISVKLHDPDDFFTRFHNPDPFAATMTQDPFLTSTVYYDDKWMHQQELKFKKWLNTLLTPPEHLNADVDTIRVDVGKVWQSCRTREDYTLAETREAVSARYHTNVRLNTLRKAACAMFRSEEVNSALCKATVCIERGTLMIRQDRDLHRDIGLQKEILELFLSYNPLWLRIGLETIYGETIPLHSNNDLVGLTKFLLTRFFSDPYIVKTHSHASSTSIKLPTFAVNMNKFMLKKFILFVFFLDYAKRNKLIGHDPCLFHKRAPHKESREILLTFSREVLSGVGDVTKVLRSYGYAVSHKQTYLDEYDYAVKDLAVDLRDGVRLCRVMELITGDRNLTNRCRVPAISRLQKVHNAELALSALYRCGYNLTGDIDAKSVADGHREKTLSLLWQIIYKFEAPRFDKAAKCVQKWWRSKILYVRIRNFVKRKKYEAAAIIQRNWRCYRARETLKVLRQERERFWAEKEKAVRIIQLRWIQKLKMLRDRRNFIAIRESVVKIQRWVRRKRETAPFVSRFRENRKAVVTIQRQWRAEILMRKQRIHYFEILRASRKIQSWWRARQTGREIYKKFQMKKKAALIIQAKWRATRLMFIAREDFIIKLKAAEKIQNWWRRILALKRDRNNYLLTKNAARTIEDWWIGRCLVNVEKMKLKLERKSAITIQRNWRKFAETRHDVQNFKQQIRACKIIQLWWKSARIAKRYKLEKQSCVKIQRWYRASVAAKFEAFSFKQLRVAAIIVQKSWRMIKARKDFLRMKNAVSRIENWYKNILVAREARREFLKQKYASIIIQRWRRSSIIARKVRGEFLEYRKNVVAVQNRFRANFMAKRTRIAYLALRKAATKIQATWRMIRERRNYVNLLRKNAAASILQKRWKETKITRQVRANFVEYRFAVVTIQLRYRAMKIARSTRRDYLEKREAAIVIQKNFRAFKASKQFRKQKNAAVVLQTRWRSRKIAIKTRENFVELRNAAIFVQRRFRANKIGAETKKSYSELRSAVLSLQTKFRANRLMKIEKERFTKIRKAAIILQSKWRMILEIRKYRLIRNFALTIQRKWRARVREAELALIRKQTAAATKIQTIWRGHKIRMTQSEAMRELRERALKATKAAVPSATIAFQMQDSIKMFLVCDTIGQLSMCLATLDTLTRLTPKGCIAFCECNLVDKIYGTLSMSNRSLPWLEVCLRCTNILITLAKLPATRNYIYRVEYIETLARLMSITVEKHSSLFLHLATLIWLLAENEHYAAAITNCPRTRWLLTSLHNSISKKKNKPCVGNLNKSRAGKEQTAPLPNSKPDWGLKQKRPRLFTTVHHAISTLMKKLKLENATTS